MPYVVRVLQCTGGVGTILAALLNDDNCDKDFGLGKITCTAVGPAAVFDFELADYASKHVTSLILG